MTAKIVFEPVRDFDAEAIFECGQTFRWSRERDRSYGGVAANRPANVAFEACDGTRGGAGRVTVTPLSGADDDAARAFWRRYLDLDRDYGAIKRRLRDADAGMDEVIARGEGLRILNQDAWEMIASFILSQNNHIPRIRTCVESLCRRFGEPVGEPDGPVFHAFPTPEALAALSGDDPDLTACRLGYRADYLVAAARHIAAAGGRAYAEGLRDADTETAEKTLRELRGVGPKVAACILLFGLGKTEAFPVDVWIGRAMAARYGTEKSGAGPAARALFGADAGIAQQYLFYFMRG